MKTEKYTDQVKRLPLTGKHIIGAVEENNIIVYQAYNPLIAAYAITNQQFGGSHYSFNRMSWIKPGFLWMMYRSGWATKENQEHILAITLPLAHFKTILRQATISSFDNSIFTSEQDWKTEIERTSVRLQWDPDHDPLGNKQQRKAIQIGMKAETLKKFCTEWILKIEDITGYVKTEHSKVMHKNIEALTVPYEDIIPLEDEYIEKRIGISYQ